MTKDDAKPLVIREWDSWAAANLQLDQGNLDSDVRFGSGADIRWRGRDVRS